MKTYLVSASVILVLLAIAFSNGGMLPFKSFGDFAFFAVLGLIFAIYRPGWGFLLFISSLALENINLAPYILKISLRPYQFMGLVVLFAIAIRFLSKKLCISFPRWKWQDGLILLFVAASFMSSISAINKGLSFKQSLITLSFAILYFLVRIYIQTLEDLKRIFPFFLSSGMVVILYSIWQNVAYLRDLNSFEVMPGRPNGTFTEPDWLGIYLVFLLSIVYVIIYSLNKKPSAISHQEINKRYHTPGQVLDPSSSVASHGVLNLLMSSLARKWKLVSISLTSFDNKENVLTDDRLLITKIKIVFTYIFLTLIFIVLILTVSRSAWIGAFVVTIGFLKIILINGTWKASTWRWKQFLQNAFFVLISVCLALVFAMGIPLTRFQIFNRVASTGGLQKITVACSQNHANVPEKITGIDELKNSGCRHINLEDIENEKSQGNEIIEIMRIDPSVNIRAEIYQKSIAQIKDNPFFGIGWGNISSVLGKDENGAGLNASNIFLETYLGSGIIGFISLVILLGYILCMGIVRYLRQSSKNKVAAVFLILGWAAIVIPNLFNSGIFLGFVWVYLAVAISLLGDKKRLDI